MQGITKPPKPKIKRRAKNDKLNREKAQRIKLAKRRKKNKAK